MFKNFLIDIPNILTVFRILLIPVVVIAFYLEQRIGMRIAAIIFTFASVTDYFDGMLARRLNAQSNFGRMLDPIADKLLVASTLMMLVHFRMAPIIPTILILCREITVSGLREYLSEFHVSLPVSTLAKIKTGIQFIAILCLILSNDIWIFEIAGTILIWVAAVLTLITGYAYLKEVLKNI